MVGLRISSKSRYGVQAMFELARHEGTGPLPLNVIAQRQGLSEHYLEQLIAPLRKAGLVKAQRGAQGGYLLAQPAREISVGDIVRLLDGPLQVPDGSSEAAAVDRVWEQVRQSVLGVIDAVTLADLVAEAQAAPMYHI